ncbi:MAG: carboxypeptidase-like regulatory domain-containing protein [Pseudomonadota bacterium]|nr:carboxypeptidase-like regulatory domain-containing protein [Pseudomonadota bacterium]
MILPVALLGCAPEPGTASGRVLDARSGAPLAGVELQLTASKTCPPIATTTDADGRYRAAALCGQATWTVAPTDPRWYLSEAVAAAPDADLRVWRAPETPGVYTVSGVDLTPLVTNTVLDVVRVFGTEQEVRFPVEIPGALPRIDADTALVVVGDVLGETPQFESLVPSPERRWFGTKEAPQPVDPWVFLGVRFRSDTEFERVPTKLDPKGIERVGGARHVQYIGGAALEPGRYALVTADGSRAFLLDFGPPDVTP